MDEESHEKEIEEINGLIEQAAQPGETGAEEAIAFDLGNIETMAREIIRLRKKLEEKDEEIALLQGSLDGAKSENDRLREESEEQNKEISNLKEAQWENYMGEDL